MGSPDKHLSIVKKFRKRRTLCLMIALGGPVLFFGVVPAGETPILFVGSFIGLFFASSLWQCPECKFSFVGSKFNPGTVWNPSFCPGCGIGFTGKTKAIKQKRASLPALNQRKHHTSPTIRIGNLEVVVSTPVILIRNMGIAVIMVVILGMIVSFAGYSNNNSPLTAGLVMGGIVLWIIVSLVLVWRVPSPWACTQCKASSAQRFRFCSRCGHTVETRA